MSTPFVVRLPFNVEPLRPLYELFERAGSQRELSLQIQRAELSSARGLRFRLIVDGAWSSLEFTSAELEDVLDVARGCAHGYAIRPRPAIAPVAPNLNLCMAPLSEQCGRFDYSWRWVDMDIPGNVGDLSRFPLPVGLLATAWGGHRLLLSLFTVWAHLPMK